MASCLTVHLVGTCGVYRVRRDPVHHVFDRRAHDQVSCRNDHKVLIRPPSITKSAPVTFPARSLARNNTRSATSSGKVNRPVSAPAAALSTMSSAADPLAFASVEATPCLPSHNSVCTGPGLTVLTRIPCPPSSFDNDFEKLVNAALAAL